MYKIILQKANNGIIKTTIDNNSNGGGNYHEEKIVYDLTDDEHKEFEKTQTLYMDLAEDLCINLGSPAARRNLFFAVEYGNRYPLSKDEIASEIDYHQTNIDNLTEALKAIEDGE